MARLKDNYNQTIILPDKIICCDVKYITATKGERTGTIHLGNRKIKVRAHPSFNQIWSPV